MANPNEYDVGDTIRLTGTFTNSSGTAVDPGTVVCKVKDPSHSITTYDYAEAEITRSAAGIYYVDVDVDQAGNWYYRFESTGDGKAAEDERFIVEASRV